MSPVHNIVMILYSHWRICFLSACEYVFFLIGRAVDSNCTITEVGVYPVLLISGLGKVIASRGSLA